MALSGQFRELQQRTETGSSCVVPLVFVFVVVVVVVVLVVAAVVVVVASESECAFGFAFGGVVIALSCFGSFVSPDLHRRRLQLSLEWQRELRLCLASTTHHR